MTSKTSSSMMGAGLAGAIIQAADLAAHSDNRRRTGSHDAPRSHAGHGWAGVMGLVIAASAAGATLIAVLSA